MVTSLTKIIFLDCINFWVLALICCRSASISRTPTCLMCQSADQCVRLPIFFKGLLHKLQNTLKIGFVTFCPQVALLLSRVPCDLLQLGMPWTIKLNMLSTCSTLQLLSNGLPSARYKIFIFTGAIKCLAPIQRLHEIQALSLTSLVYGYSCQL